MCQSAEHQDFFGFFLYYLQRKEKKATKPPKSLTVLNLFLSVAHLMESLSRVQTIYQHHKLLQLSLSNQSMSPLNNLSTISDKSVRNNQVIQPWCKKTLDNPTDWLSRIKFFLFFLNELDSTAKLCQSPLQISPDSAGRKKKLNFSNPNVYSQTEVEVHQCPLFFVRKKKSSCNFILVGSSHTHARTPTHKKQRYCGIRGTVLSLPLSFLLKLSLSAEL